MKVADILREVDLLKHVNKKLPQLEREVFVQLGHDPFLKNVKLSTQACHDSGKTTKRLIIEVGEDAE